MVTVDELHKSVTKLERELHEIKEILQLSNHYALAEAAKAARTGAGTWHSLDKMNFD